jgi:hypothetical protein
MGKGPHRFIWREPKQCHDCWTIGWGAQCESAHGIASKRGTIPSDCDGKWLCVKPMGNTRRSRVAGQ